ADGREALELARRGPEPFPAVVTDPPEAEVVVAAASEEAAGEGSEDDPAPRFLCGEAAEPPVENERGVVGAKPRPYVSGGTSRAGGTSMGATRRIGETAAPVKGAF